MQSIYKIYGITQIKLLSSYNLVGFYSTEEKAVDVIMTLIDDTWNHDLEEEIWWNASNNECIRIDSHFSTRPSAPTVWLIMHKNIHGCNFIGKIFYDEKVARDYMFNVIRDEFLYLRSNRNDQNWIEKDDILIRGNESLYVQSWDIDYKEDIKEPEEF